MHHYSFIFVLIALYGTYLNANQDKNGFVFWIISNTGFAIINLEVGMYAQAFLFSAYLALAIKGLISWK